jgi:hypothetical protein
MPTLLPLPLPLPQLPTHEDLPELKKFEIHFLKIDLFFVSIANAVRVTKIWTILMIL